MLGPVIVTSSCTIYFKSHRDARSSLIKLQWIDSETGKTIIAIEEIPSVQSHTLYCGDTFNGYTIPVNTPITVYTASRNGLRQSEWSLPFTIQFTKVATPEINSIVPGVLEFEYENDNFTILNFEEFATYE